jgi:hypothetical protein
MFKLIKEYTYTQFLLKGEYTTVQVYEVSNLESFRLYLKLQHGIDVNPLTIDNFGKFSNKIAILANSTYLVYDDIFIVGVARVYEMLVNDAENMNDGQVHFIHNRGMTNILNDRFKIYDD